MKKKKELKYVSKLFKKLQQHFNCFVQTQNPEALHGFRVQVKKIKSFLFLLESADKNKKLLKIFKPVKKLYRQTGVIRDAYIHQVQAKENNIEAIHFFKDQAAMQQQNQNKVIQHQHKHLHTIKKIKCRLMQHINSISKKEVEQFLISQVNYTKQLLNNHNFSEQLHNGRKILKHLLYNRRFTPDANLDFDEVDTMQQAIGNWHDNKLTLDFFSHKFPEKNLEAMQQKQHTLEQVVTAKAEAFNNISLI